MQTNFTKKINYLLTSLEVLHLDSSQINQHILISNRELNHMYTITLNLFHTNIIYYPYTETLKLMAILYQSIKKKKLSKLIQIIFKKKQLLNKYITKFYKLYSNNYSYTSYNETEQLKFKYIAITNLYIIYIINKYSNIGYLIYYLLS